MAADEIYRIINKSITSTAVDRSCSSSIAVRNRHLAIGEFLANWNKREEEDRRKRLEEEQRKQLRERQAQQERQRILEERHVGKDIDSKKKRGESSKKHANNNYWKVSGERQPERLQEKHKNYRINNARRICMKSAEENRASKKKE